MVISSSRRLFQPLHDNARFRDGRLVVFGFKRLRQRAVSSHKLGLGFHAIGGLPYFLKRSLRASDKRACWVCSHSMARIASCFLADSGM